MNGYEKILKIMREQARDPSPRLRIAQMQSEDACLLGSLLLDAEDLLVSSHLQGELREGDDVLLYRLSDETYIIMAKVVGMDVSV